MKEFMSGKQILNFIRFGPNHRRFERFGSISSSRMVWYKYSHERVKGDASLVHLTAGVDVVGRRGRMLMD